MERRKKKGFTLVELVIVIAVIAVLSAVLIPTFINVRKKSDKSNAERQCSQAMGLIIANCATANSSINFDNYYFTSGDYAFIWDGENFKETKKSTQEKLGKIEIKAAEIIKTGASSFVPEYNGSGDGGGGDETVSKYSTYIEVRDYLSQKIEVISGGTHSVTFGDSAEIKAVAKGDDGTTLSDSITITYNGLTTVPTQVGSYSVTVIYAGDERHEASSITFTLIIEEDGSTPDTPTPAVTSIELLSPSDVQNNGSKTIELAELSTFTVKAKVTSNGTEVSGATVTVKYNGQETKPTTAGTYTVTVVYDGNSDYASSTFIFTLTVNAESVPQKTDTSIEVTSDTISSGVATRTYDGETKEITAIVKANGNNIGVTPTITYDGETTAPINAGDYVVSVNYLGDDTYNESSYTFILRIEKANVSISATLNGNAVTNGETKTLSSTDGLSYNVLGTLDIATAGSVTTTYKNGETVIDKPVAAGTYTVTVAFAGNENYNASSLTFTLVIEEAEQGGGETPTLPDGVSSATVDGSTLTITFEPTLEYIGYGGSEGWAECYHELPVTISLINASSVTMANSTEGWHRLQKIRDESSSSTYSVGDKDMSSSTTTFDVSSSGLNNFRSFEVGTGNGRKLWITSIAITYSSASDAENALNTLYGN